MNSSDHTGHQAIVETVGCSGRFGTEEGQSGFVNQQGQFFWDARGIIRYDNDLKQKLPILAKKKLPAITKFNELGSAIIPQ